MARNDYHSRRNGSSNDEQAGGYSHRSRKRQSRGAARKVEYEKSLPEQEETGASGSEPGFVPGSHSILSSSDTPVMSSGQSASGTHSMEAVGSATPYDGINETASASQYSRNRYRARKSGKGKKIAIAVICVVVVALIGCGVAAALWLNSVGQTIKGNDSITNVAAEVEGEPYYVLLLGGDSREQSMTNNRTDSLMVARVDEANKNVSLISIPRDLRVKVGSHGFCKINAAIEYGGYDQTIEEVNELLDIKISYYAFIFFDGFEELVDKLGGVNVDVPEGTYYHGTWVPAGDDVLINGKEALVLARCRHGNPEDQGAYAMGDYQRTLNQRNLIKAIATKILDQDATQYPSLIEGLASCVQTNMGISKIVSLATNMKGMNMKKLNAAQLPAAGESIDGEFFAVMYDDVFQVELNNFKTGAKLDEGMKNFDTEMNGNDLTGYVKENDLYAYVNYEDFYGDFRG